MNTNSFQGKDHKVEATPIDMDYDAERMQVLLQKPLIEVCQMFIKLEDEDIKLKEYRRKLIKVRNLVVTDEEKRAIGRPKKGDKDWYSL